VVSRNSSFPRRRPEDVSVENTWLKKLRQGLDKTRRNLVNQQSDCCQGLNQAAVMEIETLLLQADVGRGNGLHHQRAAKPAEAKACRQTPRSLTSNKSCEICSMDPYNKPLLLPSPRKRHVEYLVDNWGKWSWKTTTIGKIAHIAQNLATNA